VLSVALHVAAVALAVVLPPIVAVPKVSTPEHRSVVLLVIPKKAFPVDPTEARMRVPLPAKVSADSPTAFRTVGPTGVFASPGPAQKQVALVAEHGVEQSAQLLSVPAPSYTEEAKLLNVTGEVVLKVKLTATGEVHFLQIVSGRLGHGLDEAAIDAVNQIRCRPAFKAGQPVDVIAYIRVIFKLTN
jgi:TonB family protein